MGTLWLPRAGKELGWSKGWRAGPQDRGPCGAGQGTAPRTPGNSNGEETGRHRTSDDTFFKQSSGLLGGRNQAAEPLAERWLRQGGQVWRQESSELQAAGRHTHTHTHTHTAGLKARCWALPAPRDGREDRGTVSSCPRHRPPALLTAEGGLCTAWTSARGSDPLQV